MTSALVPDTRPLPSPRGDAVSQAGQVLKRPEACLRALASLRGRLRRAFLLDGAMALGLTLAVLAALAFALDYLLVLPPAVRAVALGLAAAALLWVFRRRVLGPRSVALSDERLAQLVESVSPGMRQALVTAVDLSRPGHRGAPYLSRQLIEQVVQAAEAECSSIEPGRILDLRPVRRNGLIALAVAGLLGAGAAWRTDLAAIWLERMFLLSATRWPKTTQLLLVAPAASPVVVAMGDDLPVEAHAVRGSPSKVEVEARSEQGSRWRDQMSETAAGVFHKVFQNVSEGFRFRVRGGDDELPEVEVLVRVQPSLSRLDAWLLYPEHTGLPPTPAARPLRNPSLITVPAGTRIAYRAFTDLPVKQAFFVFKGRQEPGSTRAAAPANPGAEGAPAPAAPAAGIEPGAQPLAVQGAAPRPPPHAPEGPPHEPPERVASMFDGTFTVERDGLFQFQLVALDDLPGRRGKVVGVRAIADRAPTVRILEPQRSSEEVSPEAIVPMEFLIRDDYGVKTASLEAMVVEEGNRNGEPMSYPLAVPSTGLPPPEGAGVMPSTSGSRGGEHRPKHTLDLSRLKGISPGARLQYYAQAADFGGNTGESERYVLLVVSKQDLSRVINDRLMLIRDQLREVARQEESARKDLHGFERDLLLAADRAGAPRAAIDAEAASRLTRNRQDQERVTAGLERAVKEFEALLLRMETNRVGEEKEKDWIAQKREAVRKLAAERSPAVEKMFEALRSDAAKSPQPLERLGAISEEEHRIEREIEQLVLDLSQLGDVNAVIQQLRELERRQAEIRERTRARARGAPGPGEPAVPAGVEEGGR